MDFPQYNEDRHQVIQRALDAQVAMVNSAISLEGMKSTLDLARKYERVYPSLGLSPPELNESVVEKALDLIRSHQDEIVGVGEVGLDYYWVKERANQEKEKKYFARFINLAVDLAKPLVIHSRDAESDVLNMLRGVDVDVLLHCFSGSMDDVAEAVSREYLISIPASIIYSKKKQNIVKNTPMDYIVLETDSPFLSPKPGERNEPVNVVKVAEKIAEIKALDVEVVELVSTENAKQFYGLGF